MAGFSLAEAFTVLAAIFGPLAFGAVEPWSLAILQGLLLCVFASAAGRPNAAARTFLRWGAAPLILLALAQRLNPASSAEPSCWLPFTASAYRTGRWLALAACYGGFFWGASWAFASRHARERFLWVLFFLGVAVALIGLYQSNGPVYGFRPALYGRSPFGPYFNRAHAASMMALAWFVGAGLFLSRLAPSPANAELPASERVGRQMFIAGGLAILSLGLFKAENRGALLAMGGSGVLVALLGADLGFGRSAARVLRVAAALACAAALICAARFPGGRLKDNAAVHRLAMYRGGAAMLGDFPVFGVGAGALVAAFPYYQEPQVEDVVDHVHSDWLELALESGAVGFLFCLFALGGLGAGAVRAWRACPSARRRCLTAGVLAALGAFALHQLIDFSFHIPANAVLVLALLAWFAADSAPEEAVVPAPSRPLVFAAAALLAILCARPAAAFYWMRQAKSAPAAGRAYYLAKAYSWDHDPAIQVELSRDARALAQDDPEAAEDFLRQSLTWAQEALAQEPFNRGARDLFASALSHLSGAEAAHP